MGISKAATGALVIFVVVLGLTGYSESAADVEGPHLKVASFNIQIFGTSKYGKPEVVEQLVKIVRRYDVTLIMEIRDSSEKVIYEFVESLNTDLSETDKYEVLVSARLGRSNSKEQYAYIYKPSKLQVQEHYVFNDDKGDVFEREPFVAWFRPAGDDLAHFDFAMIGIHIKPDDAVNEMNKLSMVYDDLIDRYSHLTNVIFTGDWNADCGYVSKSDWERVTFRKDKRFTWLLDDDVDTNVATSSCAYDRFVIGGDDMHMAYEADSATVFYFDEEYGLDHEQTKDVSDHYPIELLLRPNPPTADANRDEL